MYSLTAAVYCFVIAPDALACPIALSVAFSLLYKPFAASMEAFFTPSSDSFN